MDHRLIDKTVCDADLYYVGLPLILAFQSPGVVGFGVDAK